MKYNIYALGIMVAVVSFLGFVVENVWLAMTKGYINNRNMNAPFLLGYGLLIAAFYFVCALLAVCISEIVLGEVVEKLCGFEYWNYENIPLHITKYTSIPTSIAFATIITFFMGVCFEPLMALILQMDVRWMKILSVVFMTVMGIDFIASFRRMFKRKNYYLKWKISLR